VTIWALTLYLAASTARCESSAAYADGAAVLQVARNRGPLLGLLAPRQFAWSCPPTPRSWSPRHILLALQAMAGVLDVPPWARRAWHYTGRADRPGQCQRWRGQVVGALAHTFCTRGT
jgi:hypothetical protein